MTEIKWSLLITTDPITADIYKSLLESNEIPVFLRSDATRSVHPFTVGSLADVEVLVPESNLAEAVTLIDGTEIVIEDEFEGEISEEATSEDE